MRKTFYIILLISVFLTYCVQTKTFVKTPDDYLTPRNVPTYCGTFSSFIYFDRYGKPVFNDSLTMLGNKLFDSVIRKNFRKIPKIQSEFVTDSSSAKALSLELINLVKFAQENQSIKKFPSSDVLKKLTSNLQGDDFAFVVPAGYIRSSQNYTKEMKSQFILQRQAIPIMFGTAIFSMLLSGGTSLYLIYVNNNGEKIKPYGSSCHLVVYNKSRNEITLYRQQFFNGNIKPIETKKVKKQLEYLLKEYL